MRGRSRRERLAARRAAAERHALSDAAWRMICDFVACPEQLIAEDAELLADLRSMAVR